MKKELTSLRREIATGMELFIYMYADSHNYKTIAAYTLVCIFFSFLIPTIEVFKDTKK